MSSIAIPTSVFRPGPVPENQTRRGPTVCLQKKVLNHDRLDTGLTPLNLAGEMVYPTGHSTVSVDACAAHFNAFWNRLGGAAGDSRTNGAREAAGPKTEANPKAEAES